jgi:type I site-specific restriction endonuclease
LFFLSDVENWLHLLAPFGFKANRALIIAPGVRIASQFYVDFDPTKSTCFYIKTGTIAGRSYPEPVEIRGATTNKADLDEADVVITIFSNFKEVDNRWLNSLPNDFFDLILFDEGHHSVAATWENLKSHFPAASTNLSQKY